jgi:hypothetical protein
MVAEGATLVRRGQIGLMPLGRAGHLHEHPQHMGVLRPNDRNTTEYLQ